MFTLTYGGSIIRTTYSIYLDCAANKNMMGRTLFVGPRCTMTTRNIVGTLEFTSKYRYGITSRGAPMYLFCPYDETEPEYIVGSAERDTSRNRIAIVEVGSVPPAGAGATTTQKPRGNLVRFLGSVGEYTAEVAGLLEFYCPRQKEIKGSSKEDDEDTTRQSIDAEHGWITFHIDPVGCRDIDDAIAYHPETKVWAITIADAAAAIPAGSALDNAARKAGATFYDLDGRAVRPMLPPEISEGSASLLPGQRRRGITLFCPPTGPYTWALTWITVSHSFSYESFPASAIAYDLQISRDPHLWIEELMIRYNTAAATRFRAAGVGLLRTQRASEDAAGWTAIDPELAPFAAEAATYEQVDPDSSANQGHASLGLAAYCHASSPLRRYADLVNQRILTALIRGTEATAESKLNPTLALVDHLNARTKASRQWTRDLTFLHHVTPGKVHTIDVTWLPDNRVWVPAWRRIIRIRHEEENPIGHKGRIQIFCNPTRRNWKRRVLTAAVVPSI